MSLTGNIFECISNVVKEYSGDITVRRRTNGHYSSTTGMWVEGDISNDTIYGEIQPVPGSILKALPQGRITTDMHMLYTTSDLNPSDPENEEDGDQIIIGTSVYDVIQVSRYGSHTSAVIAKGKV